MSYITSTEYAAKHNLVGPHLNNKIFHHLGINTIPLSNKHIIGLEGSSKIIEGFSTFNEGMVNIVKECKRINNVSNDDVAYIRIPATDTAELFSIDCGRPVIDSTDRVILFDVDGGNESSNLVQELEVVEAIKIVGAAGRGKFSRHYITRVSAETYKELGLEGKSKFKLNKYNCDVFCGAHLIIGPSVNNKAKEEVFFISDK